MAKTYRNAAGDAVARPLMRETNYATRGGKVRGQAQQGWHLVLAARDDGKAPVAITCGTLAEAKGWAEQYGYGALRAEKEGTA